MKLHLSDHELHSLISETMVNGERAKVIAHLEECERCRREVAFHRSVTRIVRATPPIQPPARFTERVMALVVPREQAAWLRWTLDNLGNIFGMMLVLSMIGYALTKPVVFTSQSTDSPNTLTETFQTYEGWYGQIKAFFADQAGRLKPDPSAASASSTDGRTIIVMIVVSLIVLFGLDRFVFQRISRVRTR